jgi:hypothetical protein
VPGAAPTASRDGFEPKATIDRAHDLPITKQIKALAASATCRARWPAAGLAICGVSICGVWAVVVA